MKIPLTILAAVLVLLGLFYLLAPRPEPPSLSPRTDLPWQVTRLPNGNTEVFGLQLGRATLLDAVNRFGPYEDLSIFVDPEGKKTLEAFFGTVQFGALKAKVVTAMAVAEEELEGLIARAVGREPTPSGAWRYDLASSDRMLQHERTLAAISYIPTYTGLDAEFFRTRFGEPAAWQTIDEQRVRWFYPALGVSLLLDSEGQEVIEYVAPPTMRLPASVEHDATGPQS